MDDNNDFMCGKMIEPLDIKRNSSVADFIKNVFGASGYNARRFAEACEIYERMVKSDSTIALTLAGAMTPIGMSGPLIELMERGLVDLIISTGANIYHDFHRTFDYPVIQGDFNADDEQLNKEGIARIYDTYIHDDDTMLPTDKIILEAAFAKKLEKPVSSATLHKHLGEMILEKAPSPEKSFVAKAAELDVPIFTSSPGDSSIAMNLVVPHIFGRKVLIDPVLDIIQTTAVVRYAKKNGVIIVGGGSPKNFYLQTQPTLWQILKDDIGGHDYFIQLTTDTPQWGGLSGATPQEAKSWGKVKDAENNSAVVYSCASITFPLLAKYAVDAIGGKEPKRLFSRLSEYKHKLIESSMENEELARENKSVSGLRKIMEEQRNSDS